MNGRPNVEGATHHKVKVVVIADYGAFVEIAPGVEGLLARVLKCAWSQHLTLLLRIS